MELFIILPRIVINSGYPLPPSTGVDGDTPLRAGLVDGEEKCEKEAGSMKKAISILLAVIFVVALMPSALATGSGEVSVSTESELAAALDGTCTTINITADIELENTLVIDRAVTISGGENRNELSKADTDSSNYVIKIAADNVTLDMLTVSGDYGITVVANNATIQNSDVKAALRGIQFYPDSAIVAPKINIDACVITNTKQEAPYNVDYTTDNRGLATYQVKGGTVNVTDSQILGFKYGINPLVDETVPNVVTLRDGEDTTFNITNTIVWGWTALNIWSANTDYNFTNCTLTGVNKFSGGYNDFSTIAANSGIYNGIDSYACNITFTGGVINVYQYGTNMQSVISVDNTCITRYVFEKYLPEGATQASNVEMYMHMPTGVSPYVLAFGSGTTDEQVAYYMSESSGKLVGINTNLDIYAGPLPTNARTVYAGIMDKTDWDANMFSKFDAQHEGGLCG